MNRLFAGWLVTVTLAMAPVIAHGKTNRAKAHTLPIEKLEHFENVSTYSGSTKVAVLAKQALLIDYATGKVLLEKNADEQMAPSSMTKMMTAYLVEEKILRVKSATKPNFW